MQEIVPLPDYLFSNEYGQSNVFLRILVTNSVVQAILHQDKYKFEKDPGYKLSS